MAPAADWIKMRVYLVHDPRVITMAARLADSPEYVRWATDGKCDNKRDMSVTCRVTESVTVTALSHVWGVTRRDGVPRDEDIYLPCADLTTIDRIAGVPTFGVVMASVGWVMQTPDGGLLFPKLVPHITSPDERKREQAAERKRRERDKQRDMSRSCHANVTPRQEERRIEEKSNTPHTPRRGVDDAGDAPTSTTSSRRPKATDADPLFARFWSAYPRKVAKAAAVKAFAKLAVSEELLSRMLAAIEWQSRSADWIKDGGTFIPHPATWLNQRRWEDELPRPTVVQAPTPQPARTGNARVDGVAAVIEQARREQAEREARQQRPTEGP